MNPGDTVPRPSTTPRRDCSPAVKDFTTHQTGYMVASAKNGFMNTNSTTCAGTPFNFHPEYNTARQQNQVPWAALEGGVLMEQEIGHFEACNSVTNSLPVHAPAPGRPDLQRPGDAQTCVGGSEGPEGRRGPL